MIEIEKKFKLTTEQEARLIDGAEFLGEKKFTDTYYDTADYTLTTKDLWLRFRDDSLELKVPMHDNNDRKVTHFKELESEKEILDFLGLSNDKPILETFKEEGYAPCCKVTTTRRKYKKDGFSLDLDITDFDYSIAEIELLVENESEINAASEKVIAYAKSYGLSDGLVRGKIAEYLHRKSMSHFMALVDAGILSKELL